MQLLPLIRTGNQKDIESEVNRLINSPLTDSLGLLDHQETILYFLLIVDKKIKIAKLHNQPLQEYATLLHNLHFDNAMHNNRLASLWALLLVYEWPEISINFKTPFGMLILEKTLFNVLHGTDINMQRKHELMAAFMEIDLGMVYQHLQSEPALAAAVLKHMSVIRHVDYKLIASFYTGPEYDDIIYNMMATEKGVLAMLTGRKPCGRIISKLKKGECINYALRGLEFPESFEAAVFYVRKHRGVMSADGRLLQHLDILCRVFGDQEDYVQSEIKAILAEYTKNSSEVCLQLLKNVYCAEISALLVKNCPDRNLIHSSDPFTNCYKYFMTGNKEECLKFINSADERLLLQILDSFTFTYDELQRIPLISEEVKVKVELKMGIGTRWDGNVRRYYFIVKNGIIDDLTQFYSYFLSSTDYGYIFRIFGIIFSKFEVPEAVLQKIYNDLESMKVKHFKEFVIEALPKSSHKQIFVNKIHHRIVKEWYEDTDMVLALKKYADVLAELKDSEKMADLLQVEHVSIFRKVYDYLKKADYCSELLISRLLAVYQSPILVEMQPYILRLVIRAVERSESAELGEIRAKMQGLTEQKKKLLLKDYLGEFRGVKLNHMNEVPRAGAKGVFRRDKVREKTDEGLGEFFEHFE